MVTPPTVQRSQDEPQAEPYRDGEAPADTAALIKGRYRIEFGSPLPDLDSPRARAYLARDERNEGTNLFALVCPPGMPLRAKALSSLVARNCVNVLEAVVDGIVHVPHFNRSGLVAVMQRPEGGRLADALLADRSPVPETTVIGTILPRLTEALSGLERREFAHRAVRPDNIFSSMPSSAMSYSASVSPSPRAPANRLPTSRSSGRWRIRTAAAKAAPTAIASPWASC